MKPVFCNTFNIAHNKNKSETALSFAHIYTEHNYTMKNGALTDVSGQVVDEVASVLLTREGTVALAKLLNKVVKNWGIDIDSV